MGPAVVQESATLAHEGTLTSLGERALEAAAPSDPLETLSGPPYVGLRCSSASEEVQDADEDFFCPLCTRSIQDAMSAKCGHSFCRACITAHLTNDTRCPKCGTGPLNQESLFPNYLLNKLLAKGGSRAQRVCAAGPAASSPMEQIQRSILHDAKLSVTELDSLVSALLEKKKRMEANEQDVQMEVLLDFLQTAQQRRKQLLERVRAEIAVLEVDIAAVQFMRSQILAARRRAARGPSPAAIERGESPAPVPVGSKRTFDQSSSGVPRSPGGSEGGSSSGSPPPAAACETSVSRKRRVMEHLDALEASYFALRSQPPTAPFTLGPAASPFASPAFATALQPAAPSPLLSPASSSSGRPPSGPSGQQPHASLLPPSALSPAVGCIPVLLYPGVQPGCSTTPPPPSSLASPRTATVPGPPTPPEERAAWAACDPPLRSFAANLANFTKYHRIEVVRTIESTDLFHSSNIVSSVEFDRDHELFATAGVTKKIRVYDLEAACRSDTGPAGRLFPVQEISTRTKLSCLSWNAYVKSHLLSSDYDGTVALWDVQSGQQISVYDEHEKRVWSVDFCRPDPLRWASGSDDGKVKIWSCNDYSSCTTIEVPNRANVCSVRFNPVTAFNIAVGAADHKVYYFDLRHVRQPVLTFGHRKAVSYVRFLTRTELVSASTDSTLKLWSVERGECRRTFTGHANEKNFVGLSAEAGLVACGSEDNSVYLWHRALPRPILSYSFSARPAARPAAPAPSASSFAVGPAAALFSAPPVPGGADGAASPAAGGSALQGGEVEDESGRFISSVCLRHDGETIVAANSVGTVKILRLVSG